MRKPTNLICKTLVIFFAFLLGLSINACQGLISPATPAPAQATAPALAEKVIETTTEQVPATPHLGQLYVQYPLVIQPGASKTVNFHISIPSELASSSIDSYQRDVRQPNDPRPLGRYTEYTTLIFVAQRMRVELVAPNFAIQELYPAEQSLDLSTPTAATKWGWTISAPATPNEYVLVVKVYMATNPVPIWVGSFDVVVEAPTPVPLPTFTPAPTPLSTTDRVFQNIADNAVTLIAALLTTIVALLGLYLQQRKPRTPRK
jgi:hypothetical protein